MSDLFARPEAPDSEKPVATVDPKEARRVVLSSAIGTAIEAYDFLLYGTAAALVFGPQFFPAENPAIAQLGSLASFAIGFLFRPVGGMIAGHFGDRLGRKKVMLWSFMVMGLSSMLIAFLPTYAAIGVLAPILLVTLRSCQGLAVGAEWSGAALMAVEHAPKNKRGRYGTAPGIGGLAGGVLASGAFALTSALSGDHFDSWGWRIPFAASFGLIIYGFYLRRRLTESPLFAEAVAHQPEKAPLVTVVTKHPISVLRGVAWALTTAATGYIVAVFGVNYAIKTAGMERTTVLLSLNAAYILAVLAMLVVGRIIDRHRRRVLIVLALCQIPLMIPLFPLLGTGTALGAVLGFSFVFIFTGSMEASRGDVLTNLFPTSVSYSGVALSYNLAYVLAGLTPLFAASVYAATGSVFWVVVLSVVCALVAFPTALIRRRPDPVEVVLAD